MKYKIALIIIAVLITLGISLGIGYHLTNKNNDFVNENTIQENKIEEKKEEVVDIPIIIDEESVKKVDEEIKKQQEEIKKQEIKKETAKSSDNKNTTAKKNTEVKQETSKVETKQEESVKETTTKTVVSTENIKEESSEPYKYGVVLKEVKTYTVTTYSDGTTDKKLINTKKSYDSSGYNATTNDLKSEATSLAGSNKSIYNKVLENVNTYRSEVGANNIVLDDKLSIAATIRAMEMAYSGVFDASHNRPNGSSCFTVLKETGISYFYNVLLNLSNLLILNQD